MGYINSAIGETSSQTTTERAGTPGPKVPEGPQGPKGETGPQGGAGPQRVKVREAHRVRQEIKDPRGRLGRRVQKGTLGPREKKGRLGRRVQKETRVILVLRDVPAVPLILIRKISTKSCS